MLPSQHSHSAVESTSQHATDKPGVVWVVQFGLIYLHQDKACKQKLRCRNDTERLTSTLTPSVVPVQIYKAIKQHKEKH